jgi:iron(III) transport system substrate-binding protein
MMKRFIMVGLLTGVLFLQACTAETTSQQAAPTQAQGQTQQTEAQQTTPQSETPAEATTPTAETGTAMETIILYSNALSDGRGEWIQEHAAAALGLDVQLVDGGGVAIANRLIAEKHNPMADVVFGFNPMLWVALENDGILVPHTPPWAAEVPTYLHHSNGLFHAVILVGNLLVYDLEQTNPEDAPKDWLDLWQDERFHERYAIPHALTGSTVQMVLSGIFGRYLDPNGYLGVSDEGWKQIEGKFANGVVTDQDMFMEIVNPNSTAAMSQMWSHGVPVREEQYGIKVGVVVPDVGIPFSIEGVALVNGANNPEAAKRFIDWFGTAEVMHAFSAEFGFLPAHPNALDGLGGITPFVASLPHQSIDWPTVAANIGEWMEHIYLEYMQ